MYYQDINEMLAKGIKTENMPSDYAEAVNLANQYLVEGKGKKPAWIDEFLESNRCKLVETICRATSAAQGISSLQGYSEGYFNEIVQNANDLHCGESIEFRASRSNRAYSLNCEYDDKGFMLSNIYAFLNREMSDKSEGEDQTGKFGVGIKSFFKFVDTLKIESNVLFDFIIQRKNGDNDVYGKTTINPQWNGGKTVLSISYNPEYESSFNTGKLTALIDYLCGYKHIDAARCFLTGADTDLVFDIRSLLFMMINSRNKKNISTLKFSGSAHNVEITCREDIKIKDVRYDDETWRAGLVVLSMCIDNISKHEKKYLVFSHDGISAAFPVGVNLTETNRMYATYYLKADVQNQILPMGMLIDSKHANIHRNDVGDSEDSINDVYNKIRGYLKNLYGFMCSEEAAVLSCANEISDAFHSIVGRYLLVDKRDYWETPLHETYYDNARLPKVIGEKAKLYVVAHNDKEAFDKASYQEGDITRELRETYYEYIEEKAAYDLRQLLANERCISGVKKTYYLLSDPGVEIPDENREAAEKIVNYFGCVKDFLAYAISGERRTTAYATDAEIDNWLLLMKDKTGKYFNAQLFLKYVGRYELNDAIAYDGSIRQINLSFKDYLFNGTLIASNGLLAQYQNKFYDEKYFHLKEELLKKRYIDAGNKKNQYMIRCIRPCGRSVTGWDGTYDYYEMTEARNVMEELSEPQLLLERMATDPKFTGLWLYGSTLKLFETRAKAMWRRDYQFKNYTIDEQQIINLSCIRNMRLKSFSDFISAVKYRTVLPENLKNFIHLTCCEDMITTRDMAEQVLPVITDIPEGEKTTYLLDEFEPKDIQIKEIFENSNNNMPVENIEFIYKITGYKIHLYRFLSNTRRKILAYFGNGVCAVKVDASKKFREVASCNLADKNIYIFYDNIPNDLQQAVNSVLEQMNVCTRNLALLEGYIHNGNTTKTMSYMSRRRNLVKVRKKLVLDWADVCGKDVPRIDDMEIMYRLLTARGSYDVFCPICSDIPLEMFDYGEDTKKKHSRRIILLENENPDTNKEVPYIITVACSYCCQKLRSTLIKSEFDGKKLILTTQISHGMHEKSRSKQIIELSPINIEVMKKFKV